jgi:hypothetical protein
MLYFRLYSDEPRTDSSASWGGLTTLYETDDDLNVRRQINLFDRAFFVDKFDCSWPEKVQSILRTKESHQRIRTEPLDEAVMATHRIRGDEFEFVWGSGGLREPTFGEFKRELLFDANMDVTGVYEAWWRANSVFPHHPLSQRLAMAEQALRELLAEGLVILTEDTKGQRPIPRDRHDECLRSWDTWVVTEKRPRAFFWSTEKGTAVNRESGPSLP